MGRTSIKGAVRAAGKDRIEFTIYYQGKRYRPTLKRTPTEANLRRAEKQLEGINERIATGTFNFAEEFPDYRFKHKLPEDSNEQHPVAQESAPLAPAKTNSRQPRKRTCGQVIDEFLLHCQMRVAMNDMAFSTFNGYRKILNNIWRPKIGDEEFEEVAYSRLVSIAAEHAGIRVNSSGGDLNLARVKRTTKKTYNNVVSAMRCMFDYGHKDNPHQPNPAAGLKTLRITKKDRPPVDPFAIQEAEAIIARSHAEFGDAHGNYEEFRFFTGLRQSEQMALTIHDYDCVAGKIQVNKAIVLGLVKDRTKTKEDREVTLCGRAIEVLERMALL